MFSISYTDISPPATVLLYLELQSLAAPRDAMHSSTLRALQCIVLLAKEEERKDKDVVLQISSIFSFDNYNNAYITIFENQFNVSFPHVFFS